MAAEQPRKAAVDAKSCIKILSMVSSMIRLCAEVKLKNCILGNESETYDAVHELTSVSVSSTITLVHQSDNASDRVPGDEFKLDSVGKSHVRCCKFEERSF